MAPLPDFDAAFARSTQVKKYATDIDRESAREKLAARVNPAAVPQAGAQETNGRAGSAPRAPAAPAPRRGKEPPGAFEQIMKSPVTRTIAGTITRGIMGALLGTPSGDHHTSRW